MKRGYYCLKCRKPNMGCKCGTKEFQFGYSHKLRVPTDWKKRAKFRRFLVACPIFVNLVDKKLQPMFREFIRDIKYFDTKINGFDWTYVHKNKEEADVYYKNTSRREEIRDNLSEEISKKRSEYDDLISDWRNALFEGTEEDMVELTNKIRSDVNGLL